LNWRKSLLSPASGEVLSPDEGMTEKRRGNEWERRLGKKTEGNRDKSSSSRDDSGGGHITSCFAIHPFLPPTTLDRIILDVQYRAEIDIDELYAHGGKCDRGKLACPNLTLRPMD
jgi:hypothetical protein